MVDLLEGERGLCRPQKYHKLANLEQLHRMARQAEEFFCWFLSPGHHGQHKRRASRSTGSYCNSRLDCTWGQNVPQGSTSGLVGDVFDMELASNLVREQIREE